MTDATQIERRDIAGHDHRLSRIAEAGVYLGQDWKYVGQHGVLLGQDGV